MLKVAADAKDVKFEHATGYKTAPNMRTYDRRTYEGAYMAGVVAGGMTKTNTLGVVGSIPIPEVHSQHRQLHARRAERQPEGQDQGRVGQRVVQPAQGDRGRAVADQRRRRRADAEHRLVGRAADRREGRQVRVRLGLRHEQATRPKAHLASAIINWAPYYNKAIEDVLDGHWKTSQSWWGVKEGAIDLVSISDKRAGRDEGQGRRPSRPASRTARSSIWKGPITDATTARKLLKAGESADDKFLHGINFYVKGVEGKLPS